MNDLYLQSKCSMPIIRGGVIGRHFVACRLDEGLERNCTATLVSAPPGYGKTIAVSGWIKQRALPCAWLTLDERDNDLVRFQMNFIEAMRKAAPSFGKDSPDMTFLSPSIGPDWAAGLLLNEISLLEQKVVIVLDDLHIIKSQEIFSLIRTIIDSQPENIHLLLLTREDPPLPVARWRVKRQIAELRESSLRFDIKEVQQFLQDIGVELPAREMDILCRRTEGWAAGLYLSGLALQGMPPQQRQHFVATFQGIQKYIIDYLIEEVLAGIDDSLRQFLYRTAIADTFNAAMCNALTGREDGGEMLSQLERRNLFLFPLDENRQWYRYHSLFGEILKSGIPVNQKASLHLTAAHWLEENGYPEDAIIQAVEANDYQYASTMLSRIASQLIQDGKIKTLLYKLDLLPEHIRFNSCHLTIAHAWCLLMTGKAGEAVGLLRRLNPEQLSDIQSDFIAMLDVLLLFLQISYNTSSVASLRVTVENLLEKKEDLQVYKLHSAAQYLLIHGKIEEASKKFMDTYLLARADSQHFIALLSAKDAAINLLVLGRKKECDRFCRQVLDHYDIKRKGSSPLAAMMYLPMAVSSYAGNDLDAALNYIEEGLAIYRQLSMAYLVIQAELQLSVIQQGLGHTDVALEAITDTIDSLLELDFHQAIGFMKAVKADFLLAACKWEQAVWWAEDASAELQGPISYVNERQAVIYARVLIRINRAEEARKLLERLENAMIEGRRNYRLVTVYLLQSMLHHRQNRKEQAIESMEKALSLAANEGLFRLFLDEGPEVLKIIKSMPPMCAEFTGKLFMMAQGKNASEVQGEPGRETLKSVKPRALLDCLSEREIEVLRLAADGCSNLDIASALYITLGTVKWHMNNILSKTGTNRRTQAIDHARKLNLI